MDKEQLRRHIEAAREHMRADNPQVGHTVFLMDESDPLEILELDFDQCHVRTMSGVTRWELIYCYVPF